LQKRLKEAMEDEDPKKWSRLLRTPTEEDLKMEEQRREKARDDLVMEPPKCRKSLAAFTRAVCVVVFI